MGVMPDSDTPASCVVFMAFDVETTGLNASRDRIVELGAIRFSLCGGITAATNWLVNPHRGIPKRAIEIHGITDEMVADAPDFGSIWPVFAELCEGTVLLAHNAPFDIRFVRMELERAGLVPPAWPVLDTLRLSRVWFPDAPSHAMDQLVPYLGLPGDVWHRAMADCSHIVSLMELGVAQRPELNVDELVRAAGGVRWLDGGTGNEGDSVERKSEGKGVACTAAVTPCTGRCKGVCAGGDSRAGAMDGGGCPRARSNP